MLIKFLNISWIISFVVVVESERYGKDGILPECLCCQPCLPIAFYNTGTFRKQNLFWLAGSCAPRAVPLLLLCFLSSGYFVSEEIGKKIGFSLCHVQ